MHHNRLAWHETLELHELVVFQSVGLFKLKKLIKDVKDPALHALYAHTIQSLESNLHELLQFYPMAPRDERMHMMEDTGFYAGDLLTLAKTMVRNYAIAITETATPALREVLAKQLNMAIMLHAQVYYYMNERGYYPSYDLEQLLTHDVSLANKALRMQ
jgi:spore coat protein F